MTSRRNLLRTASGVVAATVVSGALIDPSPARAQTLTAAVGAEGSPEFYVTIVGTQQKFKGESLRKGREAAIPGIAFNYAIKSPRDSATGQATGKRQHKPVTFVKEWGASTPMLFQALVTNEQLSSVVFEFVQLLKGEERVHHTIKLTNANVTELEQYKRFNVSGHQNADDPRNLEQVSFTFQKIEVTNSELTVSDDWAGPDTT